MAKDAGFRIRVERDLRVAFVRACRAADRPAAEVIREFMQEFVEGTQQRAQAKLFPELEPSSQESVSSLSSR